MSDLEDELRVAREKLEAIRRRALETPLSWDVADLRGYVLGVTSHRDRILAAGLERLTR